MYKQHGWVKPPKDANTPIIRYFRLNRFIDLLDSESLYFTRLSQFNDPYDGILPDGTKSLEKDHFTNLPRNPEDDLTDFEMLMRSINRTNRYCTYASCWYGNKHESAAMWELYGNQGIAIQSTFAGLRGSLSNTKDDVYIGEMTYFDFSAVQPPTYGNTLSAAYSKRIEYEYERELRAVIVRTPEEWTHGDLSEELIARQPLGLRVPIDVGTLIQGIILAANTQVSALKVINDKLTSLGIVAPLKTSRLSEAPRLI